MRLKEKFAVNGAKTKKFRAVRAIHGKKIEPTP